MLVSGESWDLYWFLQFIFSAFLLVLGLHTLLKNTASKYFEVDANFDAPVPPTLPMDDPICAVCGKRATKKCSRCKAVRYCSQVCQQSHWKSGHKFKCKDFDHTHSSAVNSTQNEITNPGFKASATGNKTLSSVALIPGGGTSRLIKQQPKDFLFPYDEFIKFFNWDKPRFRPCGLLNCGNSCFANVVLQCLSFTRPLVAYLLEKGHRRECSRNDWCFLCEFETHVEKTRLSTQAFSPVNILSRLPNIGGTLGYGRQEDAHEFMRFSIDNMQSVCLDEFGGEKVIPPNLQETTLIQHIFGGNLQSKVNCTKCDKISNQYEHMMDLTVEIHGDAASLEECLDQFTVKEWLQGENMYKCDGCNDYVKASKRLTVKRAPNILTIALKRFQNGIFGKLNKRVAFPETLDLSPYMSDVGDGSDVYKLYAVVVHIDMLNASFFGHYICYIKDFHGNWYRIDDWKVMSVELEEVLSQGAYMLLYSRTRPIVRTLTQPFNMHNQEKIKFWVSARSSGLQTTESSGMAEVQTVKVEGEPGPTEQPECLCNMETVTCRRGCEVLPSDRSLDLKVSDNECKSTGMSSDAKIEHSEDMDMIDFESTSDVANEISCSAVESSYIPISPAAKDLGDVDMGRSVEETSGCKEEQDDTDMAKSGPSSGLPNGFSFFNKDSTVSVDYQNVREDSEHIDVVKCKSSTAKVNANYSSGFASANESAIPVEDDGTSFSGVGSFPTETDEGNGITKVKLSGDKLIM